MEYITHYYTPEEITIMANDIKANVPIKAIAKTRSVEFGRKGDGMLKKIRQIKRALIKGFSIQEIIDKKTTETYNKKPKTMQTLKFYSAEENRIMVNAIASGEPIRQIARRLSKELDRPTPGLEQKLYLLKKYIPNIAEWKNSKRIKTVKKQTQLNFTPATIVQEPAEIGIEVPHGMTFEGKPKRIMLHSDHFRIYF